MSTTTSVTPSKSCRLRMLMMLRPPTTAPSGPKISTTSTCCPVSAATRAFVFAAAWSNWLCGGSGRFSRMSSVVHGLGRLAEPGGNDAGPGIEASACHEKNVPIRPRKIVVEKPVHIATTVGDAGIPAAFLAHLSSCRATAPDQQCDAQGSHRASASIRGGAGVRRRARSGTIGVSWCYSSVPVQARCTRHRTGALALGPDESQEWRRTPLVGFQRR